jgi:tetratricopeptide (TPR) repeat protein
VVRKGRIYGAAFLVSLVTLLVYLPALQNGFVNWDDQLYVYKNSNIWALDVDFFKWIFSAFHASNWHPLTWLSHAIDYALWGLNPLGHHLTSIIFHGLNTFIVVLLITRLVSLVRMDGDIGIINHEDQVRQATLPSERSIHSHKFSLIVGAVTGLLFGLHPLHVESVAWVSERKDVLCAFFFFLSVFSYIQYTSSVQGRRGVQYGLCLLFFILSLMSKPMAVTLPVVLLILDVYPLGRLDVTSLLRSKPLILTEKLPFFMFSAAALVLTFMAQKESGAIKSLDVHPMGERVLVAFRSLCFYLYKTVWPRNLAPLYPYPSEISVFGLMYTGTIITVLGITLFCIWAWRRQKVWAVVWTYYVVTLMPVLGIVQVGEQAAADRYTYISGLGVVLLVGLGSAYGWREIMRKGNGAFRTFFASASVIFILLALSFKTVNQIEVWKDSMTLWNWELKMFPDSFAAYKNRGKAYKDLGKYNQAVRDYDKSVALNPDYADAYVNRGNVYKELKFYQRALEDYNTAIVLDHDFAVAYFNRGVVYSELREYEKSIENYNKVIELAPSYAYAYLNRGLVYEKSGDYQKALQDIGKAMRINHKDREVMTAYGNIHTVLERYQLALEELNKVIELYPKFPKVYYSRGIVYEKTGDYQQAIKDYTKAIDLQSDYNLAHINRGIVYGKLGHIRRAIQDFDKAIQLDSQNSLAYFNRGTAYKILGNYQQAKEDFQISARIGNKKAQEYLMSQGIAW